MKMPFIHIQMVMLYAKCVFIALNMDKVEWGFNRKPPQCQHILYLQDIFTNLRTVFVENTYDSATKFCTCMFELFIIIS